MVKCMYALKIEIKFSIVFLAKNGRAVGFGRLRVYHLTAPGRLVPLTPPRLIWKRDYPAGIWILKPPSFWKIIQNYIGHDKST